MELGPERKEGGRMESTGRGTVISKSGGALGLRGSRSWAEDLALQVQLSRLERKLVLKRQGMEDP